MSDVIAYDAMTDDELYDYFDDHAVARHWVSHHPWRYGQPGKGFMTKTHNVILWSTTDRYEGDHYGQFPYHGHVLRAFGYGENSVCAVGEFRVTKEGRIEIYGDHTVEDTDRIHERVRRRKEVTQPSR